MNISNVARGAGVLTALGYILAGPASLADTKAAAPTAAPAAAAAPAATPEADDAATAPTEAPAAKAEAPAPAAKSAPAPAPQATAPASQKPAPQAAAPAPTKQPDGAEAKAPPAAPVPAQAQAAVSVKSKDIAVGAPVLSADGKKIGVINRVVSDASGAVTQIHVAPGGTAGLGVPVIALPANRITGTGADVKVSLSSEEAKTLPVEGGKG